MNPVTPAAIPPDVAAACDTIVSMLEQAGSTAPRREQGNFYDSFQGKPRLGCRVSASGVPGDSLGSVGGIERGLETHGWAQDLRYVADGPDQSDIGMRRRGVLCLLFIRSPGGDDDPDTTAAKAKPSDAEVADETVECAREAPSNADAGVPDSIWRVASTAGLDSSYAIAVRWQYPPYEVGDFDGDGVRDAAVLIEERATGKLGVAFVQMGPRRIVIAGAGRPVPGGPDDFSAMRAFDVYGKTTTYAVGIPRSPSVPLIGDALWLSESDSSGAFLAWNGTAYVWDPGSRRNGAPVFTRVRPGRGRGSQ